MVLALLVAFLCADMFALSHRSEICRNLFVTDEILQKALLEVRLLCEKACSSMTGVGEQSHAVALLHVDPAVSFTLDEFCDLQQTQAAQCEKQLEVLRKRVVDIVRRACQVRIPVT